MGPVQKDLSHVRQHHYHHAGARIVVQRPQEPAQRLRIVQIEQAVIRLVGGRYVHEGQADAGEDLNDQER